MQKIWHERVNALSIVKEFVFLRLTISPVSQHRRVLRDKTRSASFVVLPEVVGLLDPGFLNPWASSERQL